MEDHYVLAGILIVLCILVTAFAGDNRVGRIVGVSLAGITLIVILRASNAHVTTIRVAGGLTMLAAISASLSATTDSDLGHAVTALLGAGLILFGPLVIIHRLTKQNEINVTTVAGAVCVYLLAGLFFALVYVTIGALSNESFFVQTEDPRGPEYVYFSFVTLTTVGYGDYTAREDLGQMVAVLEALFGQLYLVSIVALLVSRIGQSRRRPEGSGEAS
jgi:hypothetical protein